MSEGQAHDSKTPSVDWDLFGMFDSAIVRNEPGRLFADLSLEVDWGDERLDGVKEIGDPIIAGNWIHVPMVFEEGDLSRLYIDGVEYPFGKPWPNWLKVRVYRWRKWRAKRSKP